jgi:polyisoprenoid-binding protein YceI
LEFHDFLYFDTDRCGLPLRAHSRLPLSFIRARIFSVLLLSLTLSAQAQQSTLEFRPEHTKVEFTLGDVIHTVHGSFDLKHGAVHFNPDTGEISGEIVLDATSGKTGTHSRDSKMHKEVLQSDQYSEISFRPDHVEGKVGMQGPSAVQVHGVFSIHGADHEMTVPVKVEMAQEHWVANATFTVPYVKWGLKNPSTFLLRVSESVEIDVRATSPDVAPPTPVRKSK